MSNNSSEGAGQSATTSNSSNNNNRSNGGDDSANRGNNSRPTQLPSRGSTHSGEDGSIGFDLDEMDWKYCWEHLRSNFVPAYLILLLSKYHFLFTMVQMKLYLQKARFKQKNGWNREIWDVRKNMSSHAFYNFSFRYFG